MSRGTFKKACAENDAGFFERLCCLQGGLFLRVFRIFQVLGQDGREVKRFLRAGTNVSSMKLEDIKATLTEAFASEGLEKAAGFYLYTAGVDVAPVRT